MVKQNVKLWLLTSIKGILAIIFGLITLFNNELSQAAFAVLFGFFVLVTGVILTYTAFRNKHHYYWRHWLFEGVFDLVIGLLILIFPKTTVAIMTAIIGIWAIIMGSILFISYYRSWKEGIKPRIILVVSLLMLILGILILWNPFTSAAVIISVIGIFAIIYGIITIINTSRLYRSYK